MFLVAAVAVATACAHTTPLPAPAAGTVIVVDAAPEKGFNFPYLLRFPDGSKPRGGQFLLVEPNNTGKVSDDPAVHLEGAKQTAARAIGGYLARRLNVPLLMPVFPRPQRDWQIYTHALDRDTLLISSGPMRRLDLQLLAMVRDARKRLDTYGLPVEKRFLLTGFSASGTFANRFTFMHPSDVAGVASGGVNGILMLPLTSLAETSLPYPLGLSDFEKITGTRFDLKAWRRVPQFIYMGALDDNDALHFDDGYSEEERAIVYKVIGEKMQPDRWEHCQQLYRDKGANVTFNTYAGIGHGTSGPINSEITEFFRKVMAGER